MAVLELLPRFLPATDPELHATISAVRNSSRNGYDLLWHVLALYVPGFDPRVPIAQPIWSRETTILEFSESHLLFFHLQAKKHVYFTPRDRTNIFLQAIAPSKYSTAVTTLQTSVYAYRHPDNKDDLPDNPRVHGIAMSIHLNTKDNIRDLALPRINRTASSTITLGILWRTTTLGIATSRDIAPELINSTTHGNAAPAAHLVVATAIELVMVPQDQGTAPAIGVTLIAQAPKVASHARINVINPFNQACSAMPVNASGTRPRIVTCS
jgi:hypothetical protein